MSKKTLFCIDAHTCGNPVRVVANSGIFLRGKNMSEKRQNFLDEHDWIRRALMFEPRGHDQMSGSILFEPVDPENDIAILFIETSGCLPMCGHGTIGTVTVLIEQGLVTPRVPGELKIEVPAGVVKATYTMSGDKVTSVKITNVASYLEASDLEIFCPGMGNLKVDVAYGGNFYAIIDPQKNYSGLENITAADIVRYSPVIRNLLNSKYSFVHPEDKTISGLSHLLWTGNPLAATSTSRNAVFYGEKAIDRSPCGTGTSAKMAQMVACGKLSYGDTFINESIIGSTFTGRVEEKTAVGGRDAIIPTIEGWAFVTGFNTIIVDSEDPYSTGFEVK